MKRLFHAAAFGLCAVLVVAQPGPAQDDGARAPEKLVIDLQHADRLFDEAVRTEANEKDWKKAADRYVESAHLRPYGDAQAFVALFRAGQLYSHANKTRRARRAFAEAGIRGLETANVFGAARSFMNAAEMGMSERDTGASDRNLNYFRMAQRLAESPLLSAMQKQQLRERMGGMMQ